MSSEETAPAYDEKPTVKTDEEHVIRIAEGQLDGFSDFAHRISGAIPLAAWFIVVNEFCERFAYYGGSATFQNYVQNPPTSHVGENESAGALDKGQQVATALNNYFIFWAYFTPLLGAAVADQWLGKFRTILYFSFIYMAGWIVLMASSIPIGHTAEGLPIFSGAAFPLYVVSITIIGLGTGGIKSVVSPMCADQVPQKPYIIEKKGQRYLVDPDLTVQHLYNWFYWAINVGSIIGQVACTTLERSAFWKAYVLPCCIFALSILIFLSGRKRYIRVPPEGSAILKAIRCVRYGLTRRKKYSAVVPTKEGVTFSFLDYAQPIAGETEEEVTQRTWTESFPLELRQTLKACAIFPLMSIYWVCYNQMTSNLISQAGTMAHPEWLSNDVVNILDPIVLIILIPIFDYGVYPLLNRKGIRFPYIARITLGFFLGAASMAVAALVQDKIYRSEENTVSIYLQFPAYILIGASEVFASIGSLEYSYTHAPTSLKSFVSALSLVPNAAAALIGIFLSPVAEDPHLTWFYGGTAIAAGVSAVIFWFSYKKYDEEDLQMSQELKQKAHVEAEERERM